MKAEFGRGLLNSDKKSSEQFYVNNCGFYHHIDFDIVNDRPKGRQDYQLIYIVEGRMHFRFEQQDTFVPSGNCVLYRPHEPQNYKACQKDQVSFDWMHFSGTGAEQLLRSLKLDNRVYPVGSFYHFSLICKQIVNECKTARPNEILISSLALTALSLLSKGAVSSRFQSIIDTMKASENHTLSQLAALSGLSVYHFIRAFKAEYGITPYAYMQKERMEKSKFLLSDTALSIAEIAEICGFDDPLYFSRAFKKQAGISPKKFREQL